MKTALLVIAGVLVLWFVAAQIGRWRQRRRRRPVIEALGEKPFTVLDLAAVDLMEHEHDRVCLAYWTTRAMAWQFTRRPELVRTIRFDALAGVALDPNLLVLAIETQDGRHHAWQFRRARTRLYERLLAAIREARPDAGRGDTLLREIQDEIGPLAWGAEYLPAKANEYRDPGSRRPTAQGQLSAPAFTIGDFPTDEPLNDIATPESDGLSFGDIVIPWATFESIYWRNTDQGPTLVFLLPPGYIAGVSIIKVPNLGTAGEDWVKYLESRGLTVPSPNEAGNA